MIRDTVRLYRFGLELNSGQFAHAQFKGGIELLLGLYMSSKLDLAVILKMGKSKIGQIEWELVTYNDENRLGISAFPQRPRVRRIG